MFERWTRKPSRDDAFEAPLNDEFDLIYRVALRLTRNPQEAEDLTQETVLLAWRGKETFVPGTSMRAWVLKILNNLHIDRQRKHRRRSRHDVDLNATSDEPFQGEYKKESLNPEDTWLEQMLDDEVLTALEGLPDDYRLVVMLCDIEGLSYKEIAEAIERPVGTVMSRLHRARKQLQEALHDVAVERGLISGPAPSPQVVALDGYRKSGGQS